MEHINNCGSNISESIKNDTKSQSIDTLRQVSWNLFSVTGGIEEYMLYREIKRKSE